MDRKTTNARLPEKARLRARWRRECQSIPIERSSIFDLPTNSSYLPSRELSRRRRYSEIRKDSSASIRRLLVGDLMYCFIWASIFVCAFDHAGIAS
jgi:hypothetical protein